MSKNYYAYVGTNSVRGSAGIYTIRIDADTLIPTVIGTNQEYNVGTNVLTADGKYLYAGIEGMAFRGRADAGIAGYKVLEDGTLAPNGYAYAHGQRVCAIDCDPAGKTLFTASFFHGTSAIIDIGEDGTPQPARAVLESRDNPNFPPFLPKGLHGVKALNNEFFGTISVVEGALIAYSIKDGSRVEQYDFPDRAFVRWLETTGDYFYTLLQDPGDIYVFRNDLKNGKMPLIQKIPVLPEGLNDHCESTTIHVTKDKKVILAATRAENAIVVFRVNEDGTLERKSLFRLPGNCPRDFNISRDDRIVVVAGQKSDDIAVLELDKETCTLSYTEGRKVSVPSPAAVAVSGLKD